MHVRRMVGIVSVLVLLIAAVWLLPFGASFRAFVIEWVRGEDPKNTALQYFDAVGAGNSAAAMAAWDDPQTDVPGDRGAALASRRQATTQALLDAGIRDEVQVLNTQWWRTCCEPGVISTGLDAGGARLRIQVLDQGGNSRIYTADVFVRGTSYWGAAGGSPPRDWVLRDVYADGQEPLFWRWVAETTVRYIDTPAPMP